MRIEPGRLLLRARYYPAHAFAFVALNVVAVVAERSLGPVLFLGPFVLLPLFGSLPAVRDLFDEVEVEVRARVRVLEEGIPAVPFEASPAPVTCDDESDEARARQREK